MIRNEDQQFTSLTAFEKLFNRYYSMLCLVAFEMVRNKQLAEEIVDEVFINLWQKRESITITRSIRSYLVKSVHNKCINWFEQTKAERMVLSNALDVSESEIWCWSEDYPLGNLLTDELQEIIESAIESLPEQCRAIYNLSREEQLNYKGIADRLSLSVNTVKTQMKIALAKLREALRDYLSLIILLFLSK